MNGNRALRLVFGAVIVLASVNGWSQTSEPGSVAESNGAAPATVPGGTTKSNFALRRRVYAAFAKHSGIDAGSISVTAKDGVVTLNGTVPDPQQVDEVTEIAKGVQGVVSVTNRLTVQRPLSQ
jgi:hyperosmotically inducible protein